MKLRSNILKLALFATGLSGIVAEYILSTLATYFLGDSVFQWTMIVSVMMFSMGLGSRISKYLHNNLLTKFIFIEFSLSLLVAFSSLFAYTVAAYTEYTGLLIYTMSIAIGILIGLEIPMVVRLNDEFENLRVNVASVIEKDYYGSLVGGVFFAFVGLPYLGLTYTPFVLGAINFLVAMILYVMLWEFVTKSTKILLTVYSVFVVIVLLGGVFAAKPIILFGEQQKYQDKVIFTKQSRYQKIVMTQWKDDFWLYINNNQQLSTLDEVLYHEPLVHPIMSLTPTPYDVLVLGGGDGCAVREVLKYSAVRTITLVDLDPEMTNLGKTNPVITQLNNNALNNSKVKIINIDAYKFLIDTKQYFDAIIIDLPDPHTVELGRLYSQEFYRLCNRCLRPEGLMITQAGSPYFATKAYLCINKTVAATGFTTHMLHNQVITMGEWGWVLGAKNMTHDEMKYKLLHLTFKGIETKWINNESMYLMTSFGKNIFPDVMEGDSVEINQIHNPVLYNYYLKGNWDIY